MLRFNPASGALIGKFVLPISGATLLGITFGYDGNLYVADNSGYIRRFDGSTGSPTGTFSCTYPSGAPCYPYDLTFDGNGNLYVSDFNINCNGVCQGAVLKFNGTTLAVMSVFVPLFWFQCKSILATSSAATRRGFISSPTETLPETSTWTGTSPT